MISSFRLLKVLGNYRKSENIHHIFTFSVHISTHFIKEKIEMKPLSYCVYNVIGISSS